MTSLLYVDDDAAARAALERLLAGDNRWDVRTSPGGDGGLRTLTERPADVVIATLVLTDFDGIEFLRRTQHFTPRAVRVLLSGDVEGDTARRALPVAHQVFPPPATATALLVALDKLRDLRELLADDRLRQLVGAVRQLPSRPSVYFALTEAVQNSQISMAGMTEIVERDPAIAARVLQVANSAFFGGSQTTSDLGTAIAHIGFRTLHSLVAVCEVFGALADDEYNSDSVDSHLCARLARRIGADVHNDDAFTAALLRDLGVLLLRHSDDAPIPDAPLPSGHSRVSSRADCAALGFDHARIGAWLLALWGLPSLVVRGVLYHATPWNEPALVLTTGGIVYVAESLLREEQLSEDEIDHLRAFTRSRGVAHFLDEWRESAREMRDEMAPRSRAA